MIVVATARGTGVEIEAGVTRAILCDLAMAGKAEIIWLRHSHCVRVVRPMFAMAGDAETGIEELYAAGVARVGELTPGMRILGCLQCVAVTGEACLLIDAMHWIMTNVAGNFDLVMPRSGPGGKEDSLGQEVPGVSEQRICEAGTQKKCK